MAHPDLDTILNALLPFARQMLAKGRECVPFGACMLVDGTVEMVAAATRSARPSSEEIIDSIADGLRKRAATGEIRAAGICYDVRLRPTAASAPTDAVCAALSHLSGEQVDVFLPYRLRRFRGPRYGELQAAPGSLRIFGRGP